MKNFKVTLLVDLKVDAKDYNDANDKAEKQIQAQNVLYVEVQDTQDIS